MLFCLYLEVLLLVFTDHYIFGVLSSGKYINNKMFIVFTKVVEKHRNFESNIAINVVLALFGFAKPARDMLMVTNYWVFASHSTMS